ncbi:hypothetical protein [Paenibacillus sp. PCH8]|nr:hypothetical protein [Paenibacillus sp. PCH8]
MQSGFHSGGDSCGIVNPDTIHMVDYGQDLYAPQTNLDAEASC